MTRSIIASFVVLAGLTTFALAQEPPAGPPAMTEEQRTEMEARLNEAWNQLSLREKMRLMRFHRAQRAMPPEEREFVRERFERFMEMPPEERERLRKNRERWQQMSPEERERAREEFRKRRQEFEERWRREHPGEELPPPPPPHPRRHRPPPPPDDDLPPPPPPPPDEQ
jgi:hypothetical protein